RFAPRQAFVGLRSVPCFIAVSSDLPFWPSFDFGRALTGDVGLSFVRVRLLPQLSGGAQRVDLKCLPPGHFVSRLMQLPMMAAAERYCELIAHLDPQSARLCKTQVMRIAGVPSANSTRLRRDEAKVGLVPTTFWFG